jgi:uncharacterized protein
MNPSLRTVYATIPLAFAFWFFIFAWPVGNFWLKLTGSASLLAAIGLVYSRNVFKTLFEFKIRHLWVGILSALLLYGIFWIGNLAADILFSFASGQIESVYSSKAQLDAFWIALLLLFVIGPAEEIYWHGLVQRRLTGRYGATVGVLATAMVYALVHVVSMNFMLVAAAGVCGLYWGILFQREKKLIPLIISHALWDLMVFVLLPMK